MKNTTLREEYDNQMELMRQCQNELKTLIEQNVPLTDERMLEISRKCDDYTAKIYELSEQLKKEEQ